VLFRSIVDERILVDDASRDDTAAIAANLGLSTFVHDANYGYGRVRRCRANSGDVSSPAVAPLHPDFVSSRRLGLTWP